MENGYKSRIEWVPVKECPSNEVYVFRVMKKFEVRDREGNLVEGLSKNGRR